MRCPNCRCEMGNLTVCPYCGVRVYRRAAAPPPAPHPTAPVQNRTTPIPPRTAPTQYAPRHRAPARGDGLWPMLTVVLLGGIFVLELLQTVLQLHL